MGPTVAPPLTDLPLPVVVRCANRLAPRVRYVFDTMLLAAGIRARFVSAAPVSGPWILYAASADAGAAARRCLAIAHQPTSWALFDERRDVTRVGAADGIAAVLPARSEDFDAGTGVSFDLVANAFYFLSSWPERCTVAAGQTRFLYPQSAFARFGIPQDIVDRYLAHLLERLRALLARTGCADPPALSWPAGASFATVLSHDVDYIPSGLADTLWQGAKTFMRHAWRQRSGGDAIASMFGLARALAKGRDAYGCIPEIVAEEQARGVRSSFQIAVARHHARDVEYSIEDDRTRDYLRSITDAGFDLCLHGSYLSTDSVEAYVAEVATLTKRLGAPRGSRQHFLSFDLDTLFEAQEKAGIRFDMSMGFPDRIGPRTGCSFPYFPYDLRRERAFDVLEIGLFLMDVTLKGYMGLGPEAAWRAIDQTLADLRHRRGCASVVWHPIVFGGARDPGYDKLYWRLVERVRETGGIATDGSTIDAFWRERARHCASFAHHH